MFLVGLTGGIGTGKSLVSTIFKANGIPVIDADEIAREVVKPNSAAWYKIRDKFGSEVIAEDGTINREALANVVFGSAEKRRVLNEITHPKIQNTIIRQILVLFLQGHQFAVLDLPLLFEIGTFVDYLHKIIVVSCTEEQQLERVMARHKLDEHRARLRIDAQMPLDQKCQLANYVVDNSQDRKNTETQIIRIIEDLRRSNCHWKIRFVVSFFVCFIIVFVFGVTYVLFI